MKHPHKLLNDYWVFLHTYDNAQPTIEKQKVNG